MRKKHEERSSQNLKETCHQFGCVHHSFPDCGTSCHTGKSPRPTDGRRLWHWQTCFTGFSLRRWNRHVARTPLVDWAGDSYHSRVSKELVGRSRRLGASYLWIALWSFLCHRTERP